MKAAIFNVLNVIGLFLSSIIVDLLYGIYLVDGHNDYWHFALFAIATKVPVMSAAYKEVMRWIS